MNKILLVEDDFNLGKLTREYLISEGFNVILAENGKSGFQQYQEQRFDILILDIMMPEEDGLSLAKKIRQKDDNTPIIFLTAKNWSEDKINGFKIGGDDYITKPFDEDELVYRIKAILKRITQAQSEEKSILGKFVFDPNLYLLESDGFEKRLTKKETDLLSMLIANKNQLVKREDILQNIWGSNDYFLGRSLDVFITKLRKYLKPDPSIKIENVHGIGFILSY